MRVLSYSHEQEQVRQHRHSFWIPHLFRKLILAFAGSLLLAAGLELLLVPNKVLPAGVTGISVLVSQFTDVTLSLLLFILNLPFLMIGRRIGNYFILFSLLSLILMCIGTYLLHPVPPPITNPLLAALTGGAAFGFGIGLIVRSGGAIDETETTIRLKYPRKFRYVSEIMTAINLLILAGGGFVFGWDQAMYSVIAYYLALKMMRAALQSYYRKARLWIAASRTERIGAMLAEQFGAEATVLRNELNSGSAMQMLLCELDAADLDRFRALVGETDPSSSYGIISIKWGRRDSSVDAAEAR